MNTMRKSIIVTLLIIACLPAPAQIRHDADSLRKGKAKIKSDTSHIQTLIKIEGYCFFTVDLDSANLFLEQANRLYKKYANLKLQNQINIHSAQNYGVRYPDDERRHTYEYQGTDS